MGQALKLHPGFRCEAVAGIAVEALRAGAGGLELRYGLTGAIGALRIPPLAAPVRADELWRGTCFEAFVRGPAGAGYYEFNFAPSTAWAAYRFSGYRAGMADVDGIEAPRMAVEADAGRLSVSVSLNLEGLADLAGAAPWRLGLSAVIEAADGGRSYWALKHPPGDADFHHPDGFALELAAGRRP